MRRCIALIATILMIGLVPFSALAAPEPASEWTYEDTDGGVEITGYTGKSTDIVVPSELDAKPVTRIGQNAFRNADVRSVSIPNSVRYIGSFAFMDCRNLEEVRLPYRADHLGANAFSGCSSLRSIVLPKGIDAISGVFEYCEALTDVVIPYGVDIVGAYAFRGCHSLGPITVPQTVASIGSSSLAGCTSMSSLAFGGTREEWKTMANSSDLPLATRIWATDGLDFSVSIAGPAGQLTAGQSLELQVMAEGDIPDWAVLGVELDLEGIETPTYQVNLTAENRTAVLTGTVMSGAQFVRASLAAVGGRAPGESINSVSWRAPVSYIEQTHYETVQIGTGNKFTSVQDVMDTYELPEGAVIEIFNPDGSVRDPSLPLATGNQVRIQYPDGSEQIVGTVIKGDVAGTGLLGIDQLTRLASALTDETVLSDLEAIAGDLNGDGRVGLIDMVQLARMLKESVKS